MKLTYQKQRGYHHTACQLCGATWREHIPDQVAPEYVHNPGNPVLGLCLRCNNGQTVGTLPPLTHSWRIPTAPDALRAKSDGGAGESLPEPWATWTGIAHRFAGRARGQDREDLKHTIILRLAQVQARGNGHEPLSQGAMIRTASYVLHEYWRELTRRLTTLSLNTEVEDGDGDTIELWETLADDRAIDLDAWLDTRTWLTGYPRRLVDIAHKRASGIPLEHGEQVYLGRWQKKARKRLPGM